MTIPTTLVSLVLVRPAIKLVFEGRAFTAQDSELVILAARLYLLGLAGQSLIEIGSRAFYTFKDARTPLLLSVITLVVFIVLGVALSPWLGFAGLALANSLAFQC